MKNMKKLFSLALALVMMMALVVTAGATSTEPTGTITINRPADMAANQTAMYHVYCVFAMTKAANADNESGYAYTAGKAVKEAIEADENVSGYFAFTTIAGDENNFVVKATDTYGTEDAAKAFATWLKTNASGLDVWNRTANLEENAVSVTVENAPYGYYFIDSNVGTLLQLDSLDPDITVVDKNKAPTIDKIEDNETGVKNIGDTVTFTITIDAKAGAESYKVYDKLGEGLNPNNDVTVKKNENVVDVTVKENETDALAGDCAVTYATEAKPITYTKGGNQYSADFKVEFSDSFMAGLGDADKITISYTAVINDKAVSKSIGNSATMEYGDNKWTSDSTTHGGPNEDGNYMGVITIDKFDGATKGKLAGATFQLLDSAKNEINVKAVMKQVEDPENPDEMIDGDVVDYYIPDENGTASIVTDEIGVAKIEGLGAGKYYLHETKAPDGYNLATTDAEVELTYDKQTFTVSSQVKGIANNTGTELPSTGGIGTTIFTVTGALLMIGAAVLFLTKKRSEA